MRALPDIDYTHHYANWHDGSREHFDDLAGYFAKKLSTDLGHLDKGARILEVGCGGGFALGGLRILGFHNVIGCDSDFGQVQSAKAHGVPAVHVPISEFDAFLAQSCDGGFDAVLLFDVLEHVPIEQQRLFLWKLHEHLKDGGLIIVQVPNANSIFASRYRYIDWTHTASFSEFSLEFILFNSGFRNISIREADPMRFPKMDKRFPRAVILWLLLLFFRSVRRLQFLAEGGVRSAKAPMTPNIVATARRS